MLTLESFSALVGADDHPARPDGALQGECPVCGRRRYLEALPFGDGTALVRCLAGDSPREILTALRVDEDRVLRVDDSLGGFEISHDLGLPEADSFRARFLTRADLATLPKPEPLIADTLDLSTTALLAGFHGTMKSFVVLDWAASVATGSRWMGREVTSGRVLYVVGEGAFGIDGRLSAWERSRGVEIPPDRLHVFPDALQIAKPGPREDLLRVVAEERYSLIVFDTLARCAVGLDENSAEDMGLFVAALEEVKKASGACVLTVHHAGKDRATVRGSSSLEAAMDTVYSTAAAPEGLRLSRTKRKDGSTPDLHVMTLDDVEGTESAVLNPLGDDDRETIDKITGPNRERAWIAFRHAYGNFEASRFELRRHLITETGIPEGSVSRTINELKNMGALEIVSREGEPERLRANARQATKVGLPDVKPFEGLTVHRDGPPDLRDVLAGGAGDDH